MSVILAMILLIIVLSIVIFYCIGLWKLFQKAGRKGWEALIPFYSSWVLVEISGLAWWYALIIILSSLGALADFGMLASLLCSAVNFFICYNLSKKLHQNTGFAVLMWVFPGVMLPIVGISEKYQFDNNVWVSENGPFGDTKNAENFNNYQGHQGNDQNFSEMRFCSNCGKQVVGGARFCSGCGKEIEK